MSGNITIRLKFGDKIEIDCETYQAIKRAVRIYADDRVVASYAAAPHEGITPEIVGIVRCQLIVRGELPLRAHSRRHDQIQKEAVQ